jgi:hypothetical protein
MMIDHTITLQEIQDTLAEAVAPKELLLTYMCYQFAAKQTPVNNLSDIAVEGAVKFVLWNTESPVMNSPTFQEIAIYANDVLLSGGSHKIYFEEIQPLYMEDDTQIFEIVMGA